MKISPITNYSKPKYAVKLAALLAAAVSVAGCAEGGTKPANTTTTTAGGAGYKPQTTEELILSGMEETSEQTEEIRLDGDVAVTESTDDVALEGEVANTDTTTEVQVDGMLEGPEETTISGTFPVKEETTPKIAGVFGALGTAAASTAAGGSAIVGTSSAMEQTTYDDVELSGEVDTTSEYDDVRLAGEALPNPDYEWTKLEGGVAVPESTDYEEPQLMGDFPAEEEYKKPDDDLRNESYEYKSDLYRYAERNDPALVNAFYNCGDLSLGFIDDFESMCLSVEFSEDGVVNSYGIATPYLIENFSNNSADADFCAYVSFMKGSEPFSENVREKGEKIDGGYICDGYDGSEKVKILFIETDGSDLDDDLCERIAVSFAKAMNLS